MKTKFSMKNFGYFLVSAELHFNFFPDLDIYRHIHLKCYRWFFLDLIYWNLIMKIKMFFENFDSFSHVLKSSLKMLVRTEDKVSPQAFLVETGTSTIPTELVFFNSFKPFMVLYISLLLHDDKNKLSVPTKYIRKIRFLSVSSFTYFNLRCRK